MRRPSLTVLGVFLFAVAGGAVQAQQPSAERIMDQMASAYASCRSYVDEGEVRTVFLGQGGRRTVVKPFSTAFVSPSDFRFEYRDRRGEEEWNRYIIWRGGDSVKRWWSVRPGLEPSPDLLTALSAAAGVSSRASVTVPALLMPDSAQLNTIKSLSGLKLVGEEEVHGRKAYRVEGLDSRNLAVTVWIDEGSMLLVKTYAEHKFEQFETKTTTTYKPRVNVEVSREKLAFDPPDTDE